jgi:replicative DNA helicase
LEMSTDQLIQRVIMGRARVNWTLARNGFIQDRDLPAIAASASECGNAPWRICDTPNISPAYMRATIRNWIRKHQIQAVFVDYLQLLRGTKNYRGDNRQAEVAEISGGIKSIAKEFGIPIVVLAQLNRGPENRAGGKPKLADLRESGAIEQDADVVGLLHREEMYAQNEEERESMAGRAELEIVKQRNGPLGPVPLTFLKEFTRFENRAIAIPDEE